MSDEETQFSLTHSTSSQHTSPRLQTSIVSDEKDTQSTLTHSTSSQQDQDFRSTYYNHTQSLPVLSEPSSYPATTRQLSHITQLPYHQPSHYSDSPPFTLSVMQSHGYRSTPLQRLMVQENEYSIIIRYGNVSDPHLPIEIPYFITHISPPYRNTILHHAYLTSLSKYHTSSRISQQMGLSTRYKELSVEKKSVQSILSEPCDLRESYN